MKVELYGFEKILKSKKWYIGFTGINIFNRKFLGFSIFNDLVVVDLKPAEIISKPSSGIWIYIFFYNICIEFKDPWKNGN